MSALEKLRASNAWHAAHDLPLCPGANNPWLYMAYAQLLLRIRGESLDLDRVYAHFLTCEKEPGLFSRWPGGQGGVTSVDEVVGAASLDPRIAKRILGYLQKNHGVFNNVMEFHPNPLRFDLDRFPWAIVFVNVCAGTPFDPLNQALMAAHFTVASFTDDPWGNAGGRLKDWLLLDRLGGYLMVRPAAWLWKRRMRKAGWTPVSSFSVEPKEYPIFQELAPLSWG